MARTRSTDTTASGTSTGIKPGSRGRVVLAYSGGLDTSVIARWLVEDGYEVICYCSDVGQDDDFSGLDKKAKQAGSEKLIIDDLREEFVRDFVFPAIAWNARYEGRYLLGTSLARPVIAKGMVEVAKREKAQFIAHGATGKGNDQVRFELTAYALWPECRIIAPWRDPAFNSVIKGRTEAIEYAKRYGIPVTATKKDPWSSDENLLHISFEAGMLEDPAERPLDRMYKLTLPLAEVKAKREKLTVDFEEGIPVAVNGKRLAPAKLIAELNRIGFKHGVGRIDMVESRFVGMKSRGVYETPGGSILLAAHMDLEGLTVSRDLLHTKNQLAVRFSQMAYFGQWYCEEMEALMAFLKSSQRHVTGRVHLELEKGNIVVTGRESAHSLYDAAIASMEADGGAYDQSDATGFIRIQALPLRVAARRQARLDAGAAGAKRSTSGTKKSARGKARR
jgi:argininosuccinate synthase